VRLTWMAASGRCRARPAVGRQAGQTADRAPPEPGPPAPDGHGERQVTMPTSSSGLIRALNRSGAAG
jgi:hypothetical protein